MNFTKFFELAKEKGISACQIQISKSSSLSIELFKHEIDTYSVENNQSVTASGVFNGKFGVGRTQKLDKDTFPFLVNQIVTAASLIEKEEEADIFPGSPKYKKHNQFNPALADLKTEEKIAVLKSIENKIYAADKRITDVQVAYGETEGGGEFYNSYGLKLKQKRNHCYIYAGAVAKEGEEVKNGGLFKLYEDFNEINEDAFVAEVVKNAISKIGAKSIQSGKYPTVIHRDIMASLVDYFLSSAIADNVQRHTSLLEGKLGQKIANSKLTIEEKPLTKNLFFSYFDDEGVAAQNKVVVKNGVLKTYFYNRETAKKDGVKSTGNGALSGGKMGTAYGNVFVKGGKQSFEELIAPIEEGVYITEIMGLGTGMNAISGDFTCQAEGYMIRNGKVAEPITQITLGGNLLKLLGDIKGFDNKPEMTNSSISVAHCYIKSLNIGGK